MQQLPLPGMSMDSQLPQQTVVNVASVPHRSPFRYPGGKTWLVPRIRNWMSSIGRKTGQFVEPFAGGAIIGLTVAFERLAEHVTLVELDEDVAAVWQTILTDEGAHWLADQIMTLEFSSDNVEQLLSTKAASIPEHALQTIVKNRANRGGILASGAGRIKHGEAGRGIASRWYPSTLRKRILDIARIRDRLTFIHGDAFAVIESMCSTNDAVYFVDPPYTASDKRPGKRLYNCATIDHERLFDLMARVTGDFVMTYDSDHVIRDMCARHGFTLSTIAMKNTHHTKQTELIIGRDLRWLG
jgi:DNA adenine methylase